jgi:hypothetical protein
MQELEERDKQIIHRDAPKLLSPGLSFPLSPPLHTERERERERHLELCVSHKSENFGVMQIIIWSEKKHPR